MEPPVCFAFKTCGQGVALMHHLTLRVPWHDSKWNGCACAAPSGKGCCVAPDRIGSGVGSSADSAAIVPVDGCLHSFDELAREVSPRLMADMRDAIARARPMRDFAQSGVGVKTLLRSEGRDVDFPGCYVMLDAGRPVYVGISRKVFTRLRQHVLADTHNSATLAYRMAAKWARHSMRRQEAMEDPEFKREFGRARETIRAFDVAYVEIDNPLVLHVFEPYAALELGTGEWNTFETH